MFYNPARFEFTKLLEDNWQKIREELDRLDDARFVSWYQKYDYNNDWSTFSFFSSFRQEKRQKAENNCSLCPETAKILEQIPGLTTAAFSRMLPGTHIKPHRGYNGEVLRCHLGLIIPENCGIMVRGQTRTWQEGKCIVFDDTYVHEAWNFGKSRRVVLLIDVKKDLPKEVLDKYAEPRRLKEIFARQTQVARFVYDRIFYNLYKFFLKNQNW